jgi:hypothetical protein
LGAFECIGEVKKSEVVGNAKVFELSEGFDDIDDTGDTAFRAAARLEVVEDVDVS